MIFVVVYFSLHDSLSFFFFFNDTATTEIYTLSLHDALPIYTKHACKSFFVPGASHQRASDLEPWAVRIHGVEVRRDRKSTRLNSSHSQISYAVFCLKKKKESVVCASAYLAVCL